MPRTEARIKCAIWDDQDFLALPMDAKALYLAVVSQPGMTHAGVLPLPRREWVNLFPDEDATERVAMARKLVEDRRYLLIDEDTDEVLVRTYIKHDIIDGPPGTFCAAMDAVVVVRSLKLRSALRRELLRLNVDVIKAKTNKSHRSQPIDAYHKALEALGDPGDGGVPKPSRDGEYVWPDEPTDPPEDAVHDGIPHGMAKACATHPSIPADDGIPHGMGDAPVVVDVVVDGSLPVTTQLEIKEAATRERAREERDAGVRAARLVGKALPRTVGGYATREALCTRVTERIKLDLEDGALTDAVLLTALDRWAKTSKVGPGAIDYMLDDAIKESLGAEQYGSGQAHTDRVAAEAIDWVAYYRAQEAGKAPELPRGHQDNLIQFPERGAS